MNNISYRHLNAFIEVSRHGSFTHAAEHLHVTQSTLTATIKQLEAQVALQLFDRTTRRVNLTRDGERFYPVAERLISDFDTAINDLRASAQQQRGHIGIAASPSVLNSLLPPVIKTYRQAFPNIGISLKEEGASGIEENVINNIVDFGIGGNRSAHPELLYQPILQDRYGVVMTHDDPLIMADTLCWNDLKQRSLSMLSVENGIRIQLEKCISEKKIPFILENSLIEASTPATLASLIQNGIGISILPALAASTPAFHSLVFKPLSEPVLRRELCLITRKGRSIGPAGEELLKRATQYFQEAPLPAYVEALSISVKQTALRA
ncbi:LysR family transcriptional regulator [Neptunomonas japonica]|uniref:LysR family transcriptional regulator n=1 Tax=Neptunomonas japonica JAMM 1380 TaxID=1441457 RepID=A0A7R6PUF4_9GAMM|nr:LysR family transcriptional regulator [Neptunomonas japonica]BBB29683.1 LysR family transcriptional regulator [Neptunomonas japonica JAMM 1380]